MSEEVVGVPAPTSRLAQGVSARRHPWGRREQDEVDGSRTPQAHTTGGWCPRLSEEVVGAPPQLADSPRV